MSLFVTAVGAILTFAVTDSPSGVNLHVFGAILIITGLAGLAIGHWLYMSRRRTDIIYRPDGETWIEPNAPPRDPVDPLE